MKFKLLLWILIVFILVFNVSAEYYLDVTAKNITESAFESNNVTVNRLAYNVWRFNNTNVDYQRQRASIIKMFYDNVILYSDNITDIKISDSNDVNRRAISANTLASTQYAVTGPWDKMSMIKINFTTDSNLSSWTYVNLNANILGTGYATAYINQNDVNINIGNVNGATYTNNEFYKDTSADDLINPVNYTIYSRIVYPGTSNRYAYANAQSLIFTDADIDNYTSSCTTAGGFTCSNILIDYYTTYDIPKMQPKQMVVSLYPYLPYNDTGINKTTTLNYYLYDVEGSADCELFVNGVSKDTDLAIGNGTHSFNYLTTYGTEGENNINITCVDDSNTVSDIKNLFVDTITPAINSIDYYNGTGYSNVSNVITNILPFNYKVNVSDINLFSVNITLVDNESTYYNSYYNDTLTSTDFVYSKDLVLETKRYTISVTAKDKHNNIINTNSISYNFNYVRYNYTVWIVDEQTGNNFDVDNITSVKMYDDEDHFIYDFQADDTNNYNFIGNQYDKRRIELKYLDGSIINRYIDFNITGQNVSVCANYENVTHYPQILTSSRERKVIMLSQYANCYVVADYTRFAYQERYSLQAWTTDRPYSLKVFVNNIQTDLAGIDGAISSEINLDTLEFSKTQYDFNILSESISFNKNKDFNTTIFIHYKNLKTENEEVTVTITNMDTDTAVYTSNDFSDPNEFIIAFDYGLLSFNVTTLFKIEIDKVDTNGLESTLTRYFNTNIKTGVYNSKLAAVVAIFMLLFGLTLTVPRITLSWFGIIIDLATLFWISLAISTWYLTFITGLTVIFILYKIILMTNKNISTIA